MNDYKQPFIRKWEPPRKSNPIATVGAILILMAITIMMCRGCVDAVVTTVDNDEQEKPKVYRAQSPTHEQMWALDSLTQVQEVMKGKKL